MKHFFSTTKTILALLAVGLCVSCSDTWKDHYSVDPEVVPDVSILDRLEGNAQTSNFVKVLKTTKTFNGKKIVDDVSYYDLLGADQFLTVWAPVNSAVPDSLWNIYMKENKNYEENYETSLRFIKNHIARFNHPVGREETVTMMSAKRFLMKSDEIQHSKYIASNQSCKNGILHIVDKQIEFTPSLYEFITTDPQFKDNLGAFFASYTKYEINEEKSVPAGIKDGKMVYVDSVLDEKSILMDKFGYINREDSNYIVVLPTGQGWKSMYEKILPRFDYAYYEGADSLSRLWVSESLLQDAFFNANSYAQKFGDVWMTTTFDRDDYLQTGKPYHLYPSNAFEQDGYFGSHTIEIVECSNGKVYLCDEWPFDPDFTYDAPVIREAENPEGFTMENETSVTNEKRPTRLNNVPWLDDGRPAFTLSDISRGKLLQIKGPLATSKWDVFFGLYDNLSTDTLTNTGYYDVKIVVFPWTIVEKQMDEGEPAYPNIFTAALEYYDKDGKYQILTALNEKGRKKEFENNMGRADTITLFSNVNLPVCNFEMEGEPNVVLNLTSAITATKARNHFNTMLLDCIILEPVKPVADE
ncbi:MAG: hypothetical protein J5732_05015 [Bacteroidaceae bacterium]|nr:hypothetical protein [Bacteroidaceae bacterium]